MELENTHTVHKSFICFLHSKYTMILAGLTFSQNLSVRYVTANWYLSDLGGTEIVKELCDMNDYLPLENIFESLVTGYTK